MHRRGSAVSFAIATVAAVLALSVAPGVSAEADPPPPNSNHEPDGPPPTEEINEAAAAARKEGSVRVLVKLPVDFTPEGDLSSSQRQAQRSEIEQDQQAVRSELAGTEHEEVHAYDTVPYMALDVSEEAVERLRGSSRVTNVQIDRKNEPALAQSSPLVQADQMAAAGTTGAGTVVAILDTGVDSSHTFLGGRVVEEACFSSIGSLCPNGQPTQTGTGSGVNCDTAEFEECKHGTHVAGVAAGSGVTFHGVARGASIMSVQVFTEGTEEDCEPASSCVFALDSDIMAALERVYAMRATRNFAAVNLSLAVAAIDFYCDFFPEKAAIDNLLSVGIATVIASGNEGLPDAVSLPGCISTAITVGSTSKSDAVSSFSNGHPFIVDALAPGSSINSSVPGGGFESFDGTSTAAPHVTGAMALMKQRFPSLTVGERLAMLKQTGLKVTDTRASPTFTTPRIRIKQASDLAQTGIVRETLNISNFTVVPPADGGSFVTRTAPGGISARGNVIGFSFTGTASGISGSDSFASDTCMTVRAPGGATFTVGGFDGSTAPECAVNSWYFQDFVSDENGTYHSEHSDAFKTPVGDVGTWTFTFRNDWGEVEATNINWSNVTITLHKLAIAPSQIPHVLGDYNADRRTDIAIFRPSAGQWHVRNQFTVSHGRSGDLPVPGDYNGNGSTDPAVFRRGSGLWLVRGQPNVTYGRTTGDIPVPGDYDGNGTTDIAIFRPDTGEWHVRNQFIIVHGRRGDIPVPGDYNGDGRTDLAVFRPGSGLWLVRGQPTVTYGQTAGDLPVPGDYNGNGTTDIAIFRPGRGEWHIRGQTSTPIIYGRTSGDMPVPGDYNGNGTTDIAIFRRAGGQWHIRGQTSTPIIYGQTPGDIPLPLPSVGLLFF